MINLTRIASRRQERGFVVAAPCNNVEIALGVRFLVDLFRPNIGFWHIAEVVE